MDAAWVVEGARLDAGAGHAAVEPFDAFFLREYPRITALVLALTGDARTAEDIAQEALFRASQRWQRVGRYDKPGAWVRRVAINLTTSSRRRRALERRALRNVAERREPAGAEAMSAQTEAFWRLVRALPARQAAAVALYYLEDRSVADVAAAMGCAVGTAKAHLHKARAALAAALDDEGET